MLVGRGDEDACTRRSWPARSGCANLGGYLSGGMTSWREEKLPVERIERMSVPELHERWEGDGDDLQVLDVREQGEWDAGHIPGSVHRPYHDIDERAGRHRPGRAGRRRSAARGSAPPSRPASCSASAPRRVIHVVDGGVPRWTREGWPTERPEAT